MVHLLEDLGSPAHTRNDLHACPQAVLLPSAAVVGTPYCDPFEKGNDNANPQLLSGWPAFLNASPIISTQGFSTPQQFFDALQQYVSTNYYSSNTVNGIGPTAIFSDGQYIWGSCIPGVSDKAGTCFNVTFNGNTYFSVRKIAQGGPLYNASCVESGGCDNNFAGIDLTIAREQFAELGPVIAQHVDAFIQFYAPSLTVNARIGTGNGSVYSHPLSLSCGAVGGPCSALFARGQTPARNTVGCNTVVGFDLHRLWRRLLGHGHVRRRGLHLKRDPLARHAVHG